MSDSDTFLVREFAKLAGVTVRTLQFYDREGLLKPSAYTEAGYRVYRRADLLRLQQILTLKYLGFGLDEIRALMDSPSYDVRMSLGIQKTAIDQRIAQLQKVSGALDQALSMFQRVEPTELAWPLVTEIIHLLLEAQKWQWVADYYTPEQQAKLAARSQSYMPQQIVEWQRMWNDLYAGFQRLVDQNRPPDDPDAQRLAAQMHTMLNQFTQGDPGIE